MSGIKDLEEVFSEDQAEVVERIQRRISKAYNRDGV
jgi:hypothetical protein